MCKIYDIKFELHPDRIEEAKTLLKGYVHGYKCRDSCEQRNCDYGLVDLKRCTRSHERSNALNSKTKITKKERIINL